MRRIAMPPPPRGDEPRRGSCPRLAALHPRVGTASTGPAKSHPLALSGRPVPGRPLTRSASIRPDVFLTGYSSPDGYLYHIYTRDNR